jgi:hypothetical protein
MAAKGKGASMQRTASNGSTESSRKEYAKPRLTKEELGRPALLCLDEELFS